MQRFVSIQIPEYFNEGKYTSRIEEHLAKELADGWRVVHFTIAAAGTGYGSGNDSRNSDSEGHNIAWLAVLLERDHK